MDPKTERDEQPYDETLDAAKIFEEITASSGEKPPSPVAGAEELNVERESARLEEPSPGEKQKPAEPSIGELFSGLVKMSPPEKIRLEEGSIGSLFKKYIGKRA